MNYISDLPHIHIFPDIFWRYQVDSEKCQFPITRQRLFQHDILWNDRCRYMNFRTITSSDKLWCKVRNYAESCSWRAGKALASAMDHNGFSDWERVIVAIDNEKICGYCTVSKTDCIPDVDYTPYIGFVFVGEEYRGNRLSQQLIEYAIDYIKNIGYNKVYIVSDHENLYEKYGFRVVDRKIAPWGSEEKIYIREL